MFRLSYRARLRGARGGIVRTIAYDIRRACGPLADSGEIVASTRRVSARRETVRTISRGMSANEVRERVRSVQRKQMDATKRSISASTLTLEYHEPRRAQLQWKPDKQSRAIASSRTAVHDLDDDASTGKAKAAIAVCVAA